MRVLLVVVAAIVGTTACTTPLPRTPAPRYDTGDYVGRIAEDVAELNRRVRGCTEQRDSAAARYDRIARQVWHWEFWTGALGLGAGAITGFLQLDGQHDTAADIAQGSSIVVGLSLGLKGLSGVEDRLTEHKAVYDEWQSHVAYVRTSFPSVEEGLQARDSAAVEQFRLILNRARTVCP